MRRLPEQGLAWLVVRFLGAGLSRSVMTALGVALGVGLLAAVTTLGVTLKDTLSGTARAAYGAYDFAAWYPDRPMNAKEADLWRRVPDVRYGVPVLVDGQYVGIGAFPQGVMGYSLEEGRYPGPGEFTARRSVVDGLGVRIGERVTVAFPSGEVSVNLVGIRAPGGPGPLEPPDALFFELGWLQQQTGRIGQATLQLYGAKDRLLGYANLETEQPGIQIHLNSKAEDRNLTALTVYAGVFGVIALLAGLFLSGSFFYTALHERLRDLSILRAIGATPQQMERLVLREAVALGLVGGAAGLGLGVAGARSLLGLAAAGVGLARPPHLVLPWALLLGEMVLGVVVAVTAAWRPARTAGAVRPLQAMRPAAGLELGDAGGPGGVWAAAVGVLLIGGALLLEPGSGLRALCGLAGGLLSVAGIFSVQAWLLPQAANRLADRLADRLPGEALLALRSLHRHRRRTALTVTTLVLGVTLVTGVGTLFTTVAAESSRWIETRSPFDAAIYPEGHLEAHNLGTELSRQIALTEGVTRVMTMGQRLSGRSNFGNLSVTPVDLAAFSQVYDFGAIEGALTGGAVLNRDQAERMGYRIGDTLRFTSFEEMHRAKTETRAEVPLVVPVVGIVERWPWSFGVGAVVSPALLPGHPDGVIFFDYDPAVRASVLRRVRQLLAGPRFATAVLEDRSEALEENRRVGNQVWALFAAVAGIVFLIAAMGLWGTIVAGLQARRRELAVLRAVGSTPAQTRRQVVLEALVLGVAGTGLGLLCGGALAAGLFAGLAGPFYPAAVWFYLGCLVGGPVLSVLAAVGPARSVGRGTVAGALRVD